MRSLFVLRARVSESLQQHRRKDHGAKQRKQSDTVADLKKIVEEEGEDGEKLEEELSACQHFLVDAGMENGRYKVFNFQMSKLDTKITKTPKSPSPNPNPNPKNAELDEVPLLAVVVEECFEATLFLRDPHLHLL